MVFCLQSNLKMIKVKICGITNIEDALVCSREGADALGFIFSKKSPRYLAQNDAKKIIAELDPFIYKVGVFLNEEKERVAEIAHFLSLDALQFHGNEPAAYCNFFKSQYKVIKVFFPGERPLKQAMEHYVVDAYSFDIKYEEKARGTKMLPTMALKEIATLVKEGKRVIVSGGLTVKNIAAVVKLKPYAVDVASGLEEFVGKKDKALVHQFIHEVKYGSCR